LLLNYLLFYNGAFDRFKYLIVVAFSEELFAPLIGLLKAAKNSVFA